MNSLKFFYSKTENPSGLIFSVWHNLEVLYEECSKYGPRVKTDPAQRVKGLLKDLL